MSEFQRENAGRVSGHILGRGSCWERDWGREDRARRKSKTSPPRQQLLPNMSQLVKEAEIEAVQGVRGGGVACYGFRTHREDRSRGCLAGKENRQGG